MWKTLAILAAAQSLMAALPDPVPPFAATAGSRLAPEFKISTFGADSGVVEQPAYWFGNKRLGVREAMPHKQRGDHDELVSIRVDGKELMCLRFWGSSKERGFGFPFKELDGKPAKLVIDKAAKTIGYSKPYLLPDGKEATFKYTLRPLPDGKIELSWDSGSEAEVGFWFNCVGAQLDDGLEFDGKELEFLDSSALNPDLHKGTPLAAGSVSKVVYGPERPKRGFSLEFPAPRSYNASESNIGGGRQLMCQTQGGASGKATIDMGLSSSPDAAAPPPVAGIDFWSRDAVRVPAAPTRNLAQNPSFEQGLRYWCAAAYGPDAFENAAPPVYETVDSGLFGGKALALRPAGGGIRSFPIPLERGKTYTLSYYAKAEKPGALCRLGLYSVPPGSKFGRFDKTSDNLRKLAGTDWERQSFTFTADSAGVCLSIRPTSALLLDGLQLEEGDKATDFVAPPVEGRLVSAAPSNQLDPDIPFDAKFVLAGQPGATGELELVFRDFYRTEFLRLKKPYVLDAKGAASLDLPLEGALPDGLFVVEAKLGPGLVDFHRLAVFKSLEGKHPTRFLFGNRLTPRTSRPEDLVKSYVRWGWGYCAYDCGNFETARKKFGLCSKFGVGNWLNRVVTDRPRPASVDKLDKMLTEQPSFSADDLRFIEETSFEVVRDNPYNTHWTLGCESEGHFKTLMDRNYAEYAKALQAFQRGVKRANPYAFAYPDAGTSGISDYKLEVTDGYLASTRGKVKWDAVAVHPYGAIDKTGSDLDLQLGKFVAIMKANGYGPETPINIPEDFNPTCVNIPEWGRPADGTLNSDFYHDGPANYDSGWQEFIMACHAARIYVIFMKYWPQLGAGSLWANQVALDLNFAPYYFCFVPNTLGRLFPNPKYKATIRPAAGVRGYAFEDSDGNCAAAVWCAIDKVDEGLEKGPEIGVNFNGLQPEFIDLMGNRREVAVAQTGPTQIRLSPAPLFLRVKEGEADKLVAALAKAEVSGLGSSLKLAVIPGLEGKVEAKLENLTGNPLAGELLLKGAAIPFVIPPAGTLSKELPDKLEGVPGKFEPWKRTLGVAFANGKRESVKWDMDCLYVPHVAQPLPPDPDAKAWDAIPALPIANWLVKDRTRTTKYGYPGDLDAKFQLAWDKDNLYLRVEGKDDKFVPLPPTFWKRSVKNSDPQLYRNDNCVEVYFDTIASGRSNLSKGYDGYDYRFDFGPSSADGANGPASIHRLAEVYCQVAGGMAMPTKAEAAAAIKAEYRRDGGHFRYVMVFPQLQIEPLRLERGWRAGFCLFVHDKDTGAADETPPEAAPEKGVSLSTKKGAHCDRRPDLWPILVLDEKP